MSKSIERVGDPVPQFSVGQVARNAMLVSTMSVVVCWHGAAIAEQRAPTGIWKGTYKCGQGRTGATLTFNPKERRGNFAKFEFYRAKGGPRVPSGSFLYKVRYDQRKRALRLIPHRWIKGPPPTYRMIEISGQFDSRIERFSGKVHHGSCGKIQLLAKAGDVDRSQTRPKLSAISRSYGDPLPDKAIGSWPGEIKCPGTKKKPLAVRLEIARTGQGPRVQLDYTKGKQSHVALYDYRYWKRSRRLELKDGRWVKGRGKILKFSGNFWSDWDKFTGNASPGCYVGLAPPSPYKTTLKQSHKIYELPKRGRAPTVIDATGTLTDAQVRDLNANLKTNGGYQLYVRIVDNLNGNGLRSRARKMLQRMKKAGPPYENVIIISISTSIAYSYVEWADVPQLPKHAISHFIISKFKPFPNKKPAIDTAIRDAVTYFNGKFAPSTGPKQVNENLAGTWLGVAACRRKTQEVKLTLFESGKDTYSARFEAFGTFNFVIQKTGHGRYQAKSPSRSIRKKVVLHAGRGTPPVLELDVRGGCHVAFLIRHEPINGFGGIYAKQSEQETFCEKTVEPWQAEGRKVREAALRLKERLYPHLQAYAHATAGVRAMFEDAVFRKYFGIAVGELSQAQFTRLIDQVRGCAITRPTRSSYHIGDETILFEKRSLHKTKGEIDRSVLDGRLIRSVPYLAALELNLKGKRRNSTLASLLGDALKPDAQMPTIETALRKSARSLHLAPPTETLRVLGSLADRMKELKSARFQATTKARRERNAKLLQIAKIPFGRIDRRFHAMLRSLAKGEPVQLDDGTRLILGGIATELHAKCSLNLSSSERVELLAFIKSTAERVVGGSNLGSLKFGEAWRDMANGQALFNAGVAIGKAFRCSKPTVDGLARLVIDAVQSNTTGPNGGDPIFIRTCAQHLSGTQCRCLAKVGSSVIPNIHQERYSRYLVSRITKGNLFSGMQVFAVCKIARY